MDLGQRVLDFMGGREGFWEFRDYPTKDLGGGDAWPTGFDIKVR